MVESQNQRSEIELSHILKIYEQELLEDNKLCPVQKRAINDIISCRTSKLNGHLSRCNNCGHAEQSYNSCRNRNCNKCQFTRQTIWADKLKGKLLPGKYFHLVFTVPEALNNIFYINQQTCYDLLFNIAWSTLNDLAHNNMLLGAQTGAVGVLHTWSSTMVYHPHIHFLVPAGGIDEDHQQWIKAKSNYLLPVKTISKFIEIPLNQAATVVMEDVCSIIKLIYGKKYLSLNLSTLNMKIITF